ncbi:hypothetical protein EJD97_017328, partial [Solanum chilense]
IGIDLPIVVKNPSLPISMFAKLAFFLAFMKPTLTDISSIFVEGGKYKDLGDSESDRTFLKWNAYRSWPDEKGVELILAFT